MKTRLLALLLTLCLAVSLLVVPASAEYYYYNDVFNYLKYVAECGEFDVDSNAWIAAYTVDEDRSLYYALSVYNTYYKDRLDVALLDNDYMLFLLLTPNTSPACDVYLIHYPSQTTAISQLEYPTYTEDSVLEITALEGDSSMRNTMQQLMNDWMPLLLDCTADIISEKGLTLENMGFEWYGVCVHHKPDAGTVKQAPTCVEPGLITYTCLRCGETWDEELPALGHLWRYSGILTEPDDVDNHSGTGLYTCTRCGENMEDRLCAAVVFTDMPSESNWAHKPIDWAYFSGITSGKTATTFAPRARITRAEVTTFLWTAAGKPEPSLSESPFEDVTPGKYYYKAVLWAVENHVTSGKTATTFAPKAQCSRAEIVTFLWNALGKPEPSLSESPFEDVTMGKYYYKPILWAYENKVTGGTTETTFSPKAVCNRAQVVTFLYKVKDLLHPAEEPAPDPVPAEPVEP